jgi:hypothetical protein
MNTLDRMVEGVSQAGSIEASVERLMHNLANEVRIVVGNESATRSLAVGLDFVAHAVAERVLASTPMVMGTYPAPKKVAAGAIKERTS